MRVADEQLKNFVIDAGLVSRGDSDLAVAEATKAATSLGDILVREGKLSDDDLRRVSAHILGIPFMELKNEKINPAVLSLIPEPVARAHNIIAFRKSDSGLEVVMLDTDDLEAIEFIKKKTGLKILPRLTDSDSMRGALLQYQKSLKDEFGDLIKKESAALSAADPKKSAETDPQKLAAELPAVRIVDALIKHAITQGASDIHLEPLETAVLIRYRIDGILRDAMQLPKATAPSIVARIKVLSNLKLDEKRLPQDGRFKVETSTDKVSFRVSTLPTYYGEKIVMRLLREGGEGFSLEGLGFHGEALEKIHGALKKTVGLLLATGPTGSGKTTTLYTMLDILNTPSVNISTIEDPIEYQMARVNQSQVKPEIGFDFVDGLRTLLRQDPDIIMVGEIRDKETAGLAVQAALTGHLVLSTLHTNSAAGALPRLLDMQVEPFLIGSTVSVIIAQRLVRKLKEDRLPYQLSQGDIASLSKVANLEKVTADLIAEKAVAPGSKFEALTFYRPKATAENDGYEGRVGIHEVLPVTPTIRDLLTSNATSAALEKQARSEGMLTMVEDGLFKAAQGITSVEEVLRVITE